MAYKATVTVLDDQPRTLCSGRSELLQRLRAEVCELCGSEHGVEVHHVRRLEDLQIPGRAPKPAWVPRMAAHPRTTLITCHACHQAIHAGRPTAGGLQTTAPESRVQ